jgi:hypothetical protein
MGDAAILPVCYKNLQDHQQPNHPPGWAQLQFRAVSHEGENLRKGGQQWQTLMIIPAAKYWKWPDKRLHF